MLLTASSSDLSSVEVIGKPHGLPLTAAVAPSAFSRGHLGLFNDTKCKGLRLWYLSPPHSGVKLILLLILILTLVKREINKSLGGKTSYIKCRTWL